MASRKIEDLDPRIQENVRAIVKAWEAAGIDVLITCTYRSNEEQDALYAQGRNGHPGKKVTNARAGQSLHNHRLAIDIVPLVDGKAMWDSESPLWKILAGIAVRVDPWCEWGGDWSGFKDLPHFQWSALRGDGHGGLAGNTFLGAPVTG